MTTWTKNTAKSAKAFGKQTAGGINLTAKHIPNTKTFRKKLAAASTPDPNSAARKAIKKPCPRAETIFMRKEEMRR